MEPSRKVVAPRLSLFRLRNAAGYKIGNDVVFTELKCAKELADLMIAEAPRSGKCPNLNGGTVRATGHPGDWTFTPAWSGASVSDDCRLTLLEIEIRLKEKGLGLK
jgi:hypothetical protein